jgi:hypothetical protein
LDRDLNFGTVCTIDTYGNTTKTAVDADGNVHATTAWASDTSGPPHSNPQMSGDLFGPPGSTGREVNQSTKKVEDNTTSDHEVLSTARDQGVVKTVHDAPAEPEEVNAILRDSEEIRAEARPTLAS